MKRPRKVPPDAPPTEDDDRYDLGDLELAPWPTTPSMPQPDRDLDPDLLGLGGLSAPRGLPSSPPANDVTPPRRSSRPEHGRELDRNLDEAAHGPAIELDLPGNDPVLIRPRVSSQPRVSSLPSGAPTSASRSGRADDGSRAARVLADYGDPPDGLMASAGYVIRVAKRLRALSREREVLSQRTSQERSEHDVALAALGRLLAREPRVLAHASLSEQRARVQALEAELAQRTQAALGARALEQATLSSLAAQRATFEAELAPFLTGEREAVAAHARSEAELKRKRAHEQRIDIELRALERASTPPPADRRGRLEREQQERAAEATAARTAHDESTRALGVARRELTLRRGHLDALSREQEQRATQARSLDARLELEATRARDVLDAELAALADAARALGLPGASSEELARVVRSEERLDELVERLAAYDRALTLYDLSGLIKGALVWLSLLLVCVLATWLLTSPT